MFLGDLAFSLPALSKCSCTSVKFFACLSGENWGDRLRRMMKPEPTSEAIMAEKSSFVRKCMAAGCLAFLTTNYWFRFTAILKSDEIEIDVLNPLEVRC